MDLSSNVQELKGIGPKKALLLKKLGIETVFDLINYYPRGYSERTNVKKLCEVKENEEVLVHGIVLRTISKKNNYKKTETLSLLIDDGTARAEVLFFNAKYLKKAIKSGEQYSFYGKAHIQHERIQFVHPEFYKESADFVAGIIPIYPLTLGITQNEMKKWQKTAASLINEINEYIPEGILLKERLCPITHAIKHIHFPQDKQKLKEARFRLIYEEFLLLELMLLSGKSGISGKEGIAFSSNEDCSEFINSLPYSLTTGQARTVNEIICDMNSSKVMNRLIQGDVGSGKTVVAEIALFKAVKDGYQGVIMAPTEILALQHFDGLTKAFKPFNIKVGFLSGSLKAAEKRKTLEELKNGEIDVLVGTHAVISNDVIFYNLGIVITDEQHRFGVNQRKLLGAKGNYPDTLVMTATPIPRTLAVILYGELDISVIDTLPVGRKEITTKVIDDNNRLKAYEFMLSEVKKGRQCYVVAPLIEDSENLELRSAESIYQEIKNGTNEVKVALLHGDMKQIEKDRIMDAFNKGAIDVLVSTVVIEVGINVPNATLMIIENAERFGLAQLHQLRGRVGRGSNKSYCILINNGTTDISKERADIMATTSNGFIISEKDLELRGPGEFFGTRQHGIPEFKIANLLKHVRVLEMAKNTAKLILEEDPGLCSEKYKMLKTKIEMTYKENDLMQI